MKRPKPEFELVILDCDGVLVDSEIISCGTLADMLSPLDPAYDLPFVMSRFLGRPASAVIADYERLTAARHPSASTSTGAIACLPPSAQS